MYHSPPWSNWLFCIVLDEIFVFWRWREEGRAFVCLGEKEDIWDFCRELKCDGSKTKHSPFKSARYRIQMANWLDLLVQLRSAGSGAHEVNNHQKNPEHRVGSVRRVFGSTDVLWWIGLWLRKSSVWRLAWNGIWGFIQPREASSVWKESTNVSIHGWIERYRTEKLRAKTLVFLKMVYYFQYRFLLGGNSCWCVMCWRRERMVLKGGCCDFEWNAAFLTQNSLPWSQFLADYWSYTVFRWIGFYLRWNRYETADNLADEGLVWFGWVVGWWLKRKRIGCLDTALIFWGDDQFSGG